MKALKSLQEWLVALVIALLVFGAIGMFAAGSGVIGFALGQRHAQAQPQSQQTAAECHIDVAKAAWKATSSRDGFRLTISRGTDRAVFPRSDFKEVSTQGSELYLEAKSEQLAFAMLVYAFRPANSGACWVVGSGAMLEGEDMIPFDVSLLAMPDGTFVGQAAPEKGDPWFITLGPQ